MSSLTRVMGLGMVTVSMAVALVVAFFWVGPGSGAIFPSASASVLYDEGMVVGVYERVSPAVVDVSATLGSGRRLTGTGSGFLIDGMVVGVYERVSPAVVDVSATLGSGGGTHSDQQPRDRRGQRCKSQVQQRHRC